MFSHQDRTWGLRKVLNVDTILIPMFDSVWICSCISKFLGVFLPSTVPNTPVYILKRQQSAGRALKAIIARVAQKFAAAAPALTWQSDSMLTDYRMFHRIAPNEECREAPMITHGGMIYWIYAKIWYWFPSFFFLRHQFQRFRKCMLVKVWVPFSLQYDLVIFSYI